jgi:murein DD-endopeptidase MepM/ murein hydrolase activator NlpD
MRNGTAKSTDVLWLRGGPASCAALFAPAGMLLVVILGVLPLTLSATSAGSAARAVARPDPERVHLREVNLSLDVYPDPLTIVGRPRRAAPVPAAGVVVSRPGPSPVEAARTGASSDVRPAAALRNEGRRVRLVWPARGPVTSPFGWRIHPIFGTREFHTGIDIAGPTGAPVAAAYPGTVRFVGWKNGYGQLVIVYHGGGLETAYSHLSAASVEPGARVEQGQDIGRIGSTGWSTGPHLLFEVFEHGIPRDPVGYFH